MVSAVAALLISHYPGLTSDQVRDRLTMKADDLGDEGKDELYGYGKVNALRTLDPVDADNDAIISVGDGFGLPGSTDNILTFWIFNSSCQIFVK